MPRPKIYQVRLTDEEVKKLKLLIRKKATSKTISLRCQIILDMDEEEIRDVLRLTGDDK